MDHTHESIRAPRRLRAAKARALSKALLDAGDIAAAQTIQAPAVLKAQDRPIKHRIIASDSHSASHTLEGEVGVLIFGSATRPGGGWENGAKAQEEDISLASTWASQAEVSSGFYDGNGLGGLGPDAILMARGAWLYDPQGTPLTVTKPVVFISIAAPNLANPQIAELAPEVVVDHLARRLTAALDAWQQEGITTLVLGAIGCGVFQWTGDQSALALRKALNASSWIAVNGELILAMPDARLAQVFSETLNASENAFSTKRRTPRH